MARSKRKELRAGFVTEEVRKIRDMFSVLKRSYDALPDKSGVNRDCVQFDGFDHNSESEYLQAARQLQMERAYDSHMERLPGYRLLMERWQNSHDMQNLTNADLVRITAPGNSN